VARCPSDSSFSRTPPDSRCPLRRLQGAAPDRSPIAFFPPRKGVASRVFFLPFFGRDGFSPAFEGDRLDPAFRFEETMTCPFPPPAPCRARPTAVSDSFFFLCPFWWSFRLVCFPNKTDNPLCVSPPSALSSPPRDADEGSRFFGR